ncbi:Geranylgeranyl transferase type II beta subunit [Giardia duodenalis]|uniref:protein geranylgeranyltransferase type II n=2 Tax=Giardia intestinalis TaxID=5741 RepID=C6LMS2_GIAIB|nr:Rab geranylgeranyltransferase [Giardia intestinalis ATCC 50581]ESU43149.1 Geranylgeranyl transferase type II beta subunit [Giardia intestinalis]
MAEDGLRTLMLRFLVTQMEEIQNPTLMELVGLSHTKLSGLYWALCSIFILQGRQPTDVFLQQIVPGTMITIDRLLQFIRNCLIVRPGDENQEETAGFSGSPGHDMHLVHTTSGLQCLLLLNKFSEVISPELGVILANTIAGLQAEDGGFYGDYTKERDTRFCYCAVLSLTILLKRVPPLIGFRLDNLIDVDALCSYILRCLNTDGGFGTTPGDESHGGQTFCCIATMHLLDSLHLIPNIQRSLFLLSSRQCINGGLCGRPDKEPDTCYSWWIGSPVYILLDYLFNENNSHITERDDQCVGNIKAKIIFNIDALLRFINVCIHPKVSGIADRPENYPDEYHTFFSLAAMSLFDVTLPGLGQLCPMHPSLALPNSICYRLFEGERMYSIESRRSSSVGSSTRITPHIRSVRGSLYTSAPLAAATSLSVRASMHRASTHIHSSLQHGPEHSPSSQGNSPRDFENSEKNLTKDSGNPDLAMNRRTPNINEPAADLMCPIDRSENISQESISMQQPYSQLPPIDLQMRRDASSMLFEARGPTLPGSSVFDAKIYELRKISALLAMEGKTVAGIYEYLLANGNGPIPLNLLPGSSALNASTGCGERQPSAMLLSTVINKGPEVVYLTQRQAQLSDDAEVRIDKGDDKSFSTGMPALSASESRAMNILLMSTSKGKPQPSAYEDNDGCLDLNPAALDPLDPLLDTAPNPVDAQDAIDGPSYPANGFSNDLGFARISSVLSVKAPNLNMKGDRQDKVTFASPLYKSQKKDELPPGKTASRQNLLDNNTFEKLFTSVFAGEQQQSGLTDSQIINTFVDTELSRQPSIYTYQTATRNFFDSLSVQDQSDPSFLFKVYNKQDVPPDVMANLLPSGMIGRSGLDSFRDKEASYMMPHKQNLRANATASVLFTEQPVSLGLRRNRQQQSSFLYQANQISSDMLTARIHHKARTEVPLRDPVKDTNYRAFSTGVLSSVTQQMIARILGDAPDKAQLLALQKSVVRNEDDSKLNQKFNAAGGLNIGTLVSNASLDISRIHTLVQTPSRKENAAPDNDAFQDASVGMLQKGTEAADNEADVDSEVKEHGHSNISGIASNLDGDAPGSSLFNSKSQSSVEKAAHTQDTGICDEKDDNNELVISEVI